VLNLWSQIQQLVLAFLVLEQHVLVILQFKQSVFLSREHTYSTVLSVDVLDARTTSPTQILSTIKQLAQNVNWLMLHARKLHLPRRISISLTPHSVYVNAHKILHALSMVTSTCLTSVLAEVVLLVNAFVETESSKLEKIVIQETQPILVAPSVNLSPVNLVTLTNVESVLKVTPPVLFALIIQWRFVQQTNVIILFVYQLMEPVTLQILMEKLAVTRIFVWEAVWMDYVKTLLLMCLRINALRPTRPTVILSAVLINVIPLMENVIQIGQPNWTKLVMMDSLVQSMTLA
jgi:hypothetical protein